MFVDFDDVVSINVNDGVVDIFGGFDNDVVVFVYLESIEVFCFFFGYVYDLFVDGVGYVVVDEFGKDEIVFVFVEYFESVSGEG